MSLVPTQGRERKIRLLATTTKIDIPLSYKDWGTGEVLVGIILPIVPNVPSSATDDSNATTMGCSGFGLCCDGSESALSTAGADPQVKT